jgi:hypothetical protein
MADVQISCIHKPDRNDPNTRIIGVGGVHDGRPWYLPLDDAIAAQESGEHHFYTRVNNHVAWCRIGRHGLLGHPYLTTAPDGYFPNNLLDLPECPR